MPYQIKSIGNPRFLLFAAILSLQTGSLKADLFASSYNPTQVFSTGTSQPNHSGNLAFDGTHYWATGYCDSFWESLCQGPAFSEYDKAGNLIATYGGRMSGMVSYFSDGRNLYGHEWDTADVFRQTSPFGFVRIENGPFGDTLLDGPIPGFTGLWLNGFGDEFNALNGGVVNRWTLTGHFISGRTLIGYGSVPGEGAILAEVVPGLNAVVVDRLAAAGPYWLTIVNGNLSAWDYTGHRVGETTLNGAGDSYDANFSLSYANGMVFVEDGGIWRGYDVGLDASPIPEPQSFILLVTVAGLVLFRFCPRRTRH